MAANPDGVKDTYLKVIPRDNFRDDSYESLCGDGVTDTVKASNLQFVTIQNKRFSGSPGENDIDLCRGAHYLVGPNDHFLSMPGVANITAKGGIDGLRVCGKFGTLELGQFSIYDIWLRGPMTRNVIFTADAVGTVTCWWAERPVCFGKGVKIRKVPILIVAAYFMFRSFQIRGWAPFIARLKARF